MTSTFDVIVIGSYSIDMIFSGMTELPQLGKDIQGTRFNMTPGEAYISAVTLHRLGLKVGWAADFGNDYFSELALKYAREEGLDETLFVTHDRPYRRISAAASYPHERGFITYYDPEPQIPAAIPALLKSQAKIVYIPGLYYGSFFGSGMRIIRTKNMKVVMDGNSSTGDILGRTRECADIRKAIKNTDIFLPNAQEARRLTGMSDIDTAIQKLGELCPLVVVKDGANGSFAYTNNTLIHIPGIVIDPLDTTGAGDAYNCGFLRAWLDGLSIEMCVKWGNITGGLSTTELGGTTRKITAAEVKKTLLKEYPLTTDT
jgi:sugar/nucleoside kinase (ribokinase family)